MKFDSKITQHESPEHEAVWITGLNLIPLELLLENIAEEEKAGFKQVYDFSVDILTDMYINPCKYGLNLSENQRPDFYFWTYNLLFKNDSDLNESNDLVMPTQTFKKLYKKQDKKCNYFNLLEFQGISFHQFEDITIIKSNK